MVARLLRFLDCHRGGLSAVIAVLLYLALLAGRASLGVAFGPVVVALVLALAGLGVRALVAQGELAASLRAAAPLLLLGGLFLLALGVRLWRISAAAPAPGTDEAYFIEAALGIIRTGKYIPASLRYPSLLVYMELATSVLRFLAGVSSNLWTWPRQLAPENLYSWGRGAVALLGAAGLVPTYWIGERLYGRRAGLLAALFLALLPMHAAAAQIVAPEAPAALLVTLAVWFALRLQDEGTSRSALVAGACAGLATATHYPAALVLLIPLLAVILRSAVPAEPAVKTARPQSRGTLVLLTLLGALLAFVLACPAALLQVDRLVAGLAEAARAYFPPQGSAGSALRFLLQEGLGYGPALLTLLGAALVLLRFRRQEATLLLFPAVTYLALLLPRARFARDLVLLGPFCAVLAAAGVERICAWIEGRWLDRPALRRWLPWAVMAVSAGLFALALMSKGL